MELKRMWINQPSNAQLHHGLHGTNVLALQEQYGAYRIWFLSGDVINILVDADILSIGWV